MDTIGDRVREERERKGWTQDVLGKEAGLSQQAIAKIEKNKTESPRTLGSIARALRVSEVYLRYGIREEVGPTQLEMLQKLRHASQEQQQQILQYIDFVLSRREGGQ